MDILVPPVPNQSKTFRIPEHTFGVKNRNRVVFSCRGSTVSRGYAYSFYFNSKSRKDNLCQNGQIQAPNASKAHIEKTRNQKLSWGRPPNPHYDRGEIPSLMLCPLSCLQHLFLYFAGPLFISWRRACIVITDPFGQVQIFINKYSSSARQVWSLSRNKQ